MTTFSTIYHCCSSHDPKLISDKEEINIVNVSGQIKRVAKEKQELAIVFIKDDSVKKCANI